MISDKTLDEALVELLRTKKALEALRKARKNGNRRCPSGPCSESWVPVPSHAGDYCQHCEALLTLCVNPVVEHSAAKRASLDLTRKLAELRAGK